MPAANGDMSRSPSPNNEHADGDDAHGGQGKAPKDKECPFCHQSFTSSSLGRHLDLYIKSKNPKPPDGVHDVHKIREIRSKITRRQPRGSLGPKKQEHHSDRSETGADTPPPPRETQLIAPAAIVAHVSAPASVGTPAAPIEPSPLINEDTPSALQKRTMLVSERDPGGPIASVWKSPNGTTRVPLDLARPIYGGGWQSTGVITGLPDHRADMERFARTSWDFSGTRLAPIRSKSSERSALEGDETGRAAQLALREVLDSLEAARERETRVSMWDFDFFGTTFPGLCLKILPSPSLLFSLQPTATDESWPIEPPGLQQLTAVRNAVFKRASQIGLRQDSSDIQRAMWHVDRMYSSFDALGEQEKHSTWRLETLRAYSKSQKRLNERTGELKLARQQAEFFRDRFEDAVSALRRSGLEKTLATTDTDSRPDIYTQGLSGSGPLVVSADIDAALALDPEARAWSYDRLIAKWRGKLREQSAGSTPASRAQPQTQHHAYADPRSITASTDSPAASTLPSHSAPSPGGPPREVRFLWDDGNREHRAKRQKVDGEWLDTASSAVEKVLKQGEPGAPGWALWPGPMAPKGGREDGDG